MNTSKIAKSKSQEDKQKGGDFPDFKRKLELVLKLINILINLSISEGNLSNLEEKKKLIKKYDDMFKTTNNDICLSLHKIIFKEFFNETYKIKDIFDTKIFIYIQNALLLFDKFLKNEINVGILMDKLIGLFGASMNYVKNNKGKSFSFDLTNEFYSYLDDISKRTNDLKQLTSKKKSNEEEIKIKEKAGTESEYIYNIEKLKKLLEEKDNELRAVNQKFISMSLDLGTYKEINNNLKKNNEDISIRSNNIIKDKNKEIEEYQSIIKRIEQKLEENTKELKESEESRKKIDDELSKQKRINSENSILFAQYSTEISKLKESVLNLTTEVNELKKSNSFFKKENQKLKEKIQYHENEIKILTIKMQKNANKRNEILEEFRKKWNELETSITGLGDEHAFLLGKLNDLANIVNQLGIDYQIENSESFTDMDQEFF